MAGDEGDVENAAAGVAERGEEEEEGEERVVVVVGSSR